MFPGHGHIPKPSGNTTTSWRSYLCAACGHQVSGAVVAAFPSETGQSVSWLMCTNCGTGSVWNAKGGFSPSGVFGPSLQGLPAEVDAAYQEARRCMAAEAFTASELLCRKILMHVAVDKGAAEGDPFAAYLAFLETKGYVTPPMKAWVDLIRQHGNAATHRLDAPDRSRAESTVMFTAELLRIVYEMDAMAKRYIR